jgi:uncharacterized protein YdeI (YjbR/CyaY-like superfamily)
MNSKVDLYFNKAKKWQEELEKLRMIVLECGLIEELKWGVPCYTLFNGSSSKTAQKSNIVLIHDFKDYCAILFVKGALLHDEEGILIQQTENVQSGRQIRFTNVKDIAKMESVLKAYIYEAIEVEKAGLKVEFKKATEFTMPDEFKAKLNELPALKKAFNALTPGRQKGYMLHFSAPKQSKTRESRVESCIQKILSGKGFNDCTCGLSKRMPNCDGSHKLMK